MTKIFTKRFFNLSAHDQAGIVDAALRDLADGRCWGSEEDRKRAKRCRERIINKAVKYGIIAEEQTSTTRGLTDGKENGA